MKGKIVNFLDPDDIWSFDTFERVQQFYFNHTNVDLVACRLRFFGIRSDYHSLDSKFTRTHVADLRREYYCIQLSAASCFFRASVITKYLNLPELTSGKDSQVITQILLEKPFFGLIREALYYYRKRPDDSSLVQTAQFGLSFYFSMPKYISIFSIVHEHCMVE